MLDVCNIPLSKGAHRSPDEGMCVVEMAAYIAREPHSDNPKCASPVIGAFLRSWNDSLDDEDRQMLKPYAFKVVGTNTGAADDETRAWMATDWLVRVHTPAFLRLAGLTKEAQALEATARIVDAITAGKAEPVINEAERSASAAWGAARSAAWNAVRSAACSAAENAAASAAWNAARSAAASAAWSAAENAAASAAWSAACSAAWSAACSAASDELRPVVVELQKSALTLLDEMIAVGRGDSVSID